MHWIQTFTGRKLDFARLPYKLDLAPQDIITPLTRTYRYRAATPFPYSVAEHSIDVATLVAGVIDLSHPRYHHLVVAALLHDATEAFLGDVAAPVKRLLPDYRNLEDALLVSILEWAKVGPLTSEDRALIHAADMEALNRESLVFFPRHRSEWGLSPANPIFAGAHMPMLAHHAEATDLATNSTTHAAVLEHCASRALIVNQAFCDLLYAAQAAL